MKLVNTISKFLVNLLSANPTKWSNTLKQFVGNSQRFFWVFSHFMGLALKELIKLFRISSSKYYWINDSIDTEVWVQNWLWKKYSYHKYSTVSRSKKHLKCYG